MSDSFPRQQARTRRFSLGAPRTFTVSRDGSRILFLRSPSGTDPATALWLFDTVQGIERILVDPARLAADGEATPEELARRERRRERAAGITAYSADPALTTVVFSLNGELWVTDVGSVTTRALDVPGPVFDPRIDEQGRRVAWCRGRQLWAADLAAGDSRLVASDEAEEVTWGQAEFVAAEEMHRDRGHWWLEDGGLLACRVDVSPVETWWVADPAHPERPPVAHRYPAAGTTDAEVTLWHAAADGSLTEVVWDRTTFPYLPVVQVGSGGPLLVVERRDHGECQVLEVDPADGSTRIIAGQSDPAWVSWPTGLPTRLDDGRLVWTAEESGSTALVVGGEVVTPPGLEVRSVAGAGSGPGILFVGSTDPTEIELYRWSDDGTQRLVGGGVVVAAAVGGPTVVAAQRRLERAGVTAEVLDAAGAVIGTIASLADTPLLEASVRMISIGPDQLRAGVVLPRDHRAGTKLPVLMLPYGGPGAQLVLADQHAWLEAQWRADQGFAVVVCDGRGTPGRGRRWERRVHRDLAAGVLEDQVTALEGAAAAVADLDLARVGISGWSFGGYLSALAVLRRPDRFHVAVAGAPVTEWRLYDTYYTERFLGHPGEDPEVYDRQSLLPDAAGLRRPLLLIHGLVDDNVVVAHTLRLSQQLLEAGKAHAVIPLTGVTHMASQEEVAENLLLLQTRFLADALGVGAPAEG